MMSGNVVLHQCKMAKRRSLDCNCKPAHAATGITGSGKDSSSSSLQIDSSSLVKISTVAMFVSFVADRKLVPIVIYVKCSSSRGPQDIGQKIAANCVPIKQLPYSRVFTLHLQISSKLLMVAVGTLLLACFGIS